MKIHRIHVVAVAVALRSAADYCLLVQGGASNSRYGRYCKESKSVMLKAVV